MEGYAQWIALALAFVSVGTAIFMIVRLRTMEYRLRRMLGLWQRQLGEDAQRTQERLADQRDSLHGNLRDVQDSVIGMLGEISRTQQMQLDSFVGQLRVLQATNEERMERLRGDVDAKLGQVDQQAKQTADMLDRKLAIHEQRMEQIRDALAEGMQRLQDGNAKKLDEIRVTVGEKLDSTLDKRLNDSFKLVSERLEQVYKGLGEMQTLADGVGDLKKVLTNVKTRGTWGEVQLGALLEQVLAPGQYETNAQTKPGSGERVEYAVCMPGKQQEARVLLPIDAKFPMEDYRRLVEAAEAGDAQRLEEAGRALDATIRTEARRIQSKYIDPPNTTDFAIMYLPVEGLYAEALRRGEVVERLQREQRVVITGPTTLLALLNSLQMGFRTLAIEQRSSEVWSLLGAVKTEFGRFADILIRTQKRLRLASDSIEDATRKTQAIQRKLSGVQELSKQETSLYLEELSLDAGPPDEENAPDEALDAGSSD